MSTSSKAALKDLRARLGEAVKHFGGDDRLAAAVRSLEEPSARVERELDLDGDLAGLKAFRVRFEQAGTPTKGGIRFDGDADLEESERLALLMSLKCALTGLPFSGAKGGVQVDIRQLGDGDRTAIARAYALAFKDIIGPQSDVPAPDIATGPEEMVAMAQALGSEKGRDRAVVTGLPKDAGGLELREGATGEGAWRIYRRLCAAGSCPSTPRIALQGFGKAGRSFARHAIADGAKVVAISDSRSLAIDADGLDLDVVARRKDETGKVGEDDTPDRVLEIDADVLALAARSDVIDAKRARAVKAGCVVELANAPVTRGGYKALEKAGRWSVPDMLANSGGVVASYFEWLAYASPHAPDEAELKGRWEGILDRAADAVIDTANQRNVPIHTAGLIVALSQHEPETRPKAELD